MTLKALFDIKNNYLKTISILSLGVLFGVYFTYFMVQHVIISPILASSLCGLIASVSFVKKWNNATLLAIAIYCGSFAGMGSVLNAKELFLTSFLAILLLLISTKIFKGFGGKLGFIAYISSIISEIIIILIASKKLEKFSLLKPLSDFNPVLEFNIIFTVLITSFLGFYLTIFFHHKLKKSAVFSSAFPSFILAILLSFIEIPNANIIAVTFFSASFAGMVAEDVLHKKYFPFLILIHALTIILFKKNFGSYGGALGTIAFLSVFILIQIDLTLAKYFKKDN